MELYVRIRDKPHPVGHPAEKAAKLGKRGDVIAVAPDGFQWGRKELASPEHMIIRANISESEANALLTPEPGDPSTRILRKRGMMLDCDLLGLTYDGQRRAVATNKSPKQVRDAVVQKTPLTRAAVIDPRPTVIG